MRAIIQTLEGNLLLLRSRIVDKSSTNKVVDESMVTVKRLSNVNKGAKDMNLVGTRSTTPSSAFAKNRWVLSPKKTKEIKEFHTKLVVGISHKRIEKFMLKLDPNPGSNGEWEVWVAIYGLGPRGKWANIGDRAHQRKPSIPDCWGRSVRSAAATLHDGSGAEAITTANGLAKERRRSLREPKGPADLVMMRRRRQGSGWKDWSPMKLKASQTVFFDSQGLDRECSWLGGHILPMSENTASKKIQQQRRTR
ncbi:hypothetical protein ISN45_At02g006470 [Arabidopsis thaliana x Arabidopsis arenosa]|uniref:Uncharacterized protein n=1 Tax=Arabidopsis thaliana x Arabidopsis arenosa TaxID=1240361 RepID=A0A8T2FIA3_9BRAS|nr:hypothetical protein ISN45_At02g006470 [Arabidopsis thaliana x Arabidopsis arenosa]